MVNSLVCETDRMSRGYRIIYGPFEFVSEISRRNLNLPHSIEAALTASDNSSKVAWVFRSLSLERRRTSLSYKLQFSGVAPFRVLIWFSHIKSSSVLG